MKRAVSRAGLLTLLLNVGLIGPLLATTYYLDLSNGADGNDGLSPTTPWQNLQRIRNQGPQPGDVFLFKRGERWVGEQLYVTAGGTNGNPITYGAYGPTSDPAPVITAVEPLPAADDPLAWSSSGGNLWALPLAITPGRLFLDGTEVLRASAAIAEIGTLDNTGATPRWYHTGGTLYLESPGNPATVYTAIEGSQLFYTALVEGADHIHFDGLDFRGGNGAALVFFGASDGVVRNCHLGRDGNSGLLLGDTNIGGTLTATSAVLIEDNVFDSHFTLYYGTGSERGCGDGLRMIYGVNGCLVQNNTFRNWAHNAVELRAGLAGRSGVHTNLIYQNTVEAPDIPYAHPFRADGLQDLCRNNEFSYNYVRNCRTASQINGNDNWVHHNLIVGMQRSPAKAQATAHAFILGIYGTGLVCNNNRFDHNLIANTDESGFLIRGYGFSGQVADNLLRNNVLYETGLAPYNTDYPAGAGIVIYDTPADGVGGNTYQNNSVFGTSAGATAVYIWDSGTALTAAEFNGRDGQDGNTVADNRDDNPRFTDPANEDFFPQNDSPLINNGIATGLTTDFAGQPRTIGPAPDIGPFETEVIALPVTWLYFRASATQPGTVDLDWATAREQHSAYFAIERSPDARRWTERGRVLAAGASESLTTYTFSDEPVPAGRWYYRLRQVDRDGSRAYSPIRRVSVAGRAYFSWLPFGAGRVRLRAMEEWDWSQARCTVFSLGGHQLGTVVGTDVLPVASLPAGVYLVRIEGSDEQHWLRFRK